MDYEQDINSNEDELEYNGISFDDFIKKAPEFKLLDLIFLNEIYKEKFDYIISELTSKIIESINNINNASLFNEYLNSKSTEKIKVLKKREKTIISRINIASSFIRDENNLQKFKYWTEQIFTNLLFALLIKSSIRYSHKSGDYSGKGYYAKAGIDNYNVFMSITDIMELLSYIDQKIGKRKEKEITRAWFIDNIKEKFNIFSHHVKFKRKYINNKRNKCIDLVRLTEKAINDEKDEKERKWINIEQILKKGRHEKLRSDYLSYENNTQLINDKLKEYKIRVIIDGLIIKSKNFLDVIYTNHLTSKISNLNIICSINPLDKSNFNHINNFKNCENFFFFNNDIYSNKYNTINTYKDNREDIEGKGGLYILPVIFDRESREYKEIESQRIFSDIPDKEHINLHHLSFTIEHQPLYRVFSRGNRVSPQLNFNGRFYGGFWTTMKREFRRFVYADDDKEPLISLDFSAMHLRMCYHLQGEQCLNDPYTLEKYGIAKRPLFKIVSLITLNAKNYFAAIAEIQKKIKNDLTIELSEEDVKILYNDFQNEHKLIAKKYFCKDFAVTGMFYDSRVLEDAMLELMLKKNILVLPVHDELLCRAKDEDVVTKQLFKSYEKIFRPTLLRKNYIKANEPYPEKFYPVITRTPKLLN